MRDVFSIGSNSTLYVYINVSVAACIQTAIYSLRMHCYCATFAQEMSWKT